MKFLIKSINDNISGKKVLALFILTNIVYLFMLIVTIPKTMKFSNGMKLLDMMPTGYDFKYVKELFGNLGKNGRETYLTNQIPVDMIYPLLFGISYCLILAYLLKKLNKFNNQYSFLCLIPIVAGAFDYMENIGVIIMLNNYPDLTETIVNLTNTFTIAKSFSTSVFFTILLIALILIGVKFFKRNKALTNNT